MSKTEATHSTKCYGKVLSRTPLMESWYSYCWSAKASLK